MNRLGVRAKRILARRSRERERDMEATDASRLVCVVVVSYQEFSLSLLRSACERVCVCGSAKLGAGLRARRRRRASMARRSTGACPVCSGHAVQHRQLSGRVYRARAGRLGRDGALNSTTTTRSPIGPPTAGLRSAPLDGMLLPILPTASALSLLSLRPHPGACADLLASPALPMTAARTSARGPRRPRRARIARRSSGECQGG